MEKRNLEIDKSLIEDKRLHPLLEPNSHLLFQLFILKISDKLSSKSEYKILYGWVILTTRESIGDVIYCSADSEVLNNDLIVYSVVKITLYNTSDLIIKVINGFLGGKSLQKISEENRLDSSKVAFDVNYVADVSAKKNFAIRPIIFNETNTLIQRHFYEKNSLNSPYRDVPSFSLIINNLEKIQLFRHKNKYYEDWEKGLKNVLKYLYDETTLPFTLSGCVRLGNIEFINTQCSNEFGIDKVWFKNIKETVAISHSTETACKKVTVTVLTNNHTDGKNLLVNCYLTNGGQIILDECKEVFHTKNETISLTFESQEEITQIAVSIWKEENGFFQIWYKHSVPLIRGMVFNIGMVGTTGVIKSEWLNKIENANKQTSEKVREAEKISRTSYESSSIGGHKLDPWVAADNSISELVKHLYPAKSEAHFFSKGWSASEGEHGALSFLEWFKEISEDSDKIIIQDPFYDILGLEFLSRTSKSDTQFVILTCTQIMSFDDDKKSASLCAKFFKRNIKVFEPNRATRLKRFIKDYPSLFQTLKFSIYDFRSKNKGDKNLIHDRYVLTFKKNNLKKGFHLSNSIQGATKSHPLLITPIPRDVLFKLNEYLDEAINQKGDFINSEIISLHPINDKNEVEKKNKTDEVADAKFLKYLKENTKSDDDEKVLDTHTFSLDLFASELIKSKQHEFSKKWSTFGYHLAHISNPEDILELLKTKLSVEVNVKLRTYIQSSITAKIPLGFIEGEKRYTRVDYLHFYTYNFFTALDKSLNLGAFLGSTNCSGNWGVYYGCKLLIQSSSAEYLNLIKFIENQLNSLPKNLDLINHPLSKLNDIVMSKIIKRLFWVDDLQINNLSLISDMPYLKAITVGAIINKSLRNDSPSLSFIEAKEMMFKNLSIDEKLYTLATWLLRSRFEQKEKNEEYEKKILHDISEILCSNLTDDRLTDLLKILLYSGYQLIEKKITESVLIKLLEKDIIDSNKIFKIWTQEFLKLLSNKETNSDKMTGVLDIAAWAYCIGEKNVRKDFIALIKREIKFCNNEIWKPFKRDTTIWNESFERLLIIKVLLMIVLLYDSKNESKITEQEELKQVILDVENQTTNYVPRLFGGIVQISKRISEEYHKQL